jgi:hypothetical protein
MQHSSPVEFNEGKDPLRPSYKGKQFAVAAPKEGKTTDVYFEKKHLWIAEVRHKSRLLVSQVACPEDKHDNMKEHCVASVGGTKQQTSQDLRYPL